VFALLPVLPAPARAQDDEELPKSLPSPQGPVLEWRASRTFQAEYRPAWISLSSDGKRLAVCAVDGKVPGHIWDTHTGEELGRFGGNGHWFDGAQFSADGRLLAYVNDEIEICIFDLARRRVVSQIKPRRVQRGAHVINGFPAFSLDGKFLAAGVSEEGVKLWDVATAKDLNRFPNFPTKTEAGKPLHVASLAFLPDGKTLAVATNPDGVIRLLDLAKGNECRQLRPRPYSGDPNRMAFSPDGTLVAVFSGYDVISRQDPQTGRPVRRKTAEVSIWDTRDGKLVRRFSWEGDFSGKNSFKQAFGAQALKFTADGRCLIVADGDTWVRLWEVASGKQRYRVEEFISELSVANGCRLFAGVVRYKEVVVWDTALALAPPLAKALPEADSVWAGLSNADTAAAFTLMRDLMAAPRRAVVLLDKRLVAVPIVEGGVLDRLLHELDDDSFEVREAASRRLADLGEIARTATVRAIAAKPAPSAEASRRMRELLGLLERPPDGQQLRLLRAVEVLECIGAPEARRVLNRLARGEPQAPLTRDASAALERFDRK